MCIHGHPTGIDMDTDMDTDTNMDTSTNTDTDTETLMDGGIQDENRGQE